MAHPRQQPDADEGFTAQLWGVTRQYRGRIVASVLLLILAKIATVAVPLVLKRIIDAFSQPSQQLSSRLALALLVGYALLRFSSTLFNEWRDLLFARVTLSTVSQFAQKTFAHLHALGPRPRHQGHRLPARGRAVHHRPDPGRDRAGAGGDAAPLASRLFGDMRSCGCCSSGWNESCVVPAKAGIQVCQRLGKASRT